MTWCNAPGQEVVEDHYGLGIAGEDTEGTQEGARPRRGRRN